MVDQAASREERIVVFKLADESYGIDIAKVHQIIRMQHITKVPRAPEFVEGVINLRGRVIPVVNLRSRLGLPAAERSSGTRMIVVELGDQTVGIVVDGVSERKIPADSIEAPPPVITTADSDYLRGIAKVDDELIILLSLDKALAPESVEALGRVGVAGDPQVLAC